jgi:hypothetical protein
MGYNLCNQSRHDSLTMGTEPWLVLFQVKSLLTFLADNERCCNKSRLSKLLENRQEDFS